MKIMKILIIMRIVLLTKIDRATVMVMVAAWGALASSAVTSVAVAVA